MAKAKVRAVLVDGKPYKRSGRQPGASQGRTDWKRLDRQASAQTRLSL